MLRWEDPMPRRRAYGLPRRRVRGYVKSLLFGSDSLGSFVRTAPHKRKGGSVPWVGGRIGIKAMSHAPYGRGNRGGWQLH